MRIRKRMSVRSTFKMCGLIFSIIGAIFLIAGSISLASDIKFKKTAEKTEAVITDIEREQYREHGENEIRHIPIIEYTVDGVEYEAELSEYSSSMYVGKKIQVYYDPENPGRVKKSGLLLPIIFIGLSVVFLGVGCSFLAANAVSSKRKKYLIENGDALTGRITDVKLNMSIAINRRHPYKAECEVIDPFSGEKYLYSSDNITTDISGFVGMEVTVYVDKNDRSKHYVDIDSLIENYMQENKIHDYR